MRVLGEAQLDKDGVLHGWCWSPDAPQARLSVEILANEAPVTQVQASRFREDLRARGIGDGYSGFSVTLTRLANGTEGVVLAAREAQSGLRFWQALRGELQLPGDIPARLLAAGQSLGAMASAGAVPVTPRRALAGLGARLRQRAGPAAQLPWPSPAAPAALWLAVPARPEDFTGWSGWRRSARGLAAAGIQTVLTAAHPLPQAPAALPQIALPGATPLHRAGQALALCPAPGFGVMLDATPFSQAAARYLAARAPASLLVPGFLAALLRRLAPGLAAGLARWEGPAGDGLLLAGPTAALRGLGLAPGLDDGGWLAALDLVLRALAAGQEVAEWQAPWTGYGPPPLAMDSEAGQRFVARWPAGLV